VSIILFTGISNNSARIVRPRGISAATVRFDVPIVKLNQIEAKIIVETRVRVRIRIETVIYRIYIKM